MKPAVTQASCAEEGRSNVKFHVVEKRHGTWFAVCGSGSDGMTMMSAQTVPAHTISLQSRCRKSLCQRRFYGADQDADGVQEPRAVTAQEDAMLRRAAVRSVKVVSPGVAATDDTRTVLLRTIRHIELLDGNLSSDQTEKSEDYRYGLSIALRVLRDEFGRTTPAGVAPVEAQSSTYEQDLWLRELFRLIEAWRDTRDGTPSKAQAWAALWKHGHNIGPHWRARAYVAGVVAPVPMTEVLRMRKALDAIYNHNEAARAAVIQHYGIHHHPAVAALPDGVQASDESKGST
jgi:hypothetical protein